MSVLITKHTYFRYSSKTGEGKECSYRLGILHRINLLKNETVFFCHSMGESTTIAG